MFDLIQMLDVDYCGDLGPVIKFAKSILTLIQIGIPIVLIIMGTIDLGKAVLSSDEKEIKGATGKLIKRCIAAVAVFFVSTIVYLVMNLVADANAKDSNGTGWGNCWKGTANKGDDSGR